jgi:hypothetical protein
MQQSLCISLTSVFSQNSTVLRVSGKVDGVRLPKELFHVSRVMQNPQPDMGYFFSLIRGNRTRTSP